MIDTPQVRGWNWLAAMGMALAGWIISTALYHIVNRLKSGKADEPLINRIKKRESQRELDGLRQRCKIFDNLERGNEAAYL